MVNKIAQKSAVVNKAVPDDEMPIFFYSADVTASYPYGVFSQWRIFKMTVEASSLEYLRQESNSPAMEIIPAFISFNCAEQYMMYCKAIYFNDQSSALAIMETSTPREQKAIGRAVVGFIAESWINVREQVGEEGNWAKFSKDEHMKSVLLSTGDKELVEASSTDRIWGIGFNAENARRMVNSSRHRWELNLLGKSLMKVRDRIRAAKEKSH